MLGVGDLDSRRFRMLIELEGGAAHEEDTWVGCRIGLGETILRISAPVARCAMTTHDPDTGERDFDTLRAIMDYRGQSRRQGPVFGVSARSNGRAHPSRRRGPGPRWPTSADGWSWAVVT